MISVEYEIKQNEYNPAMWEVYSVVNYNGRKTTNFMNGFNSRREAQDKVDVLYAARKSLNSK